MGLKSKQTSAFKKKRGHCCIDVWRLPKELLEMPDDDKDRKFELMENFGQATEVGVSFPPNALTNLAPISFLEEAAVVIGLCVVLGGPLAWVVSMLTLLFIGSWIQLIIAIITSLFLAYHPLPSIEYCKKHVINSWFTRSMYKYFTYRFVWTGDSRQKIVEHRPWIGAGPPHGVLPFSNVLSIPGINSVASIDFVGVSSA
jgi:2-acylglycerol O-acyltransferase 2